MHVTSSRKVCIANTALGVIQDCNEEGTHTANYETKGEEKCLPNGYHPNNWA
jgi:hypothetical protein